MAFNLMSFLGGAAGAGSKALEEKRASDAAAELTKEQRQWQIATEGRADARTRKAKRDAKREKADNRLGTLTALGFTPEKAAKIASMGDGAAEKAIEFATLGLSKGIDVNTIFNFPSMSGDLGEADQQIINTTIEAAEPVKTGDLNASSTSSSSVTSGGSTDVLSREFGINTDVFKSLYAKPEKIESSYSSRLAVISQKLARPTKDTDVEALKSEQTTLLADLGAMKEAEREKKGTTTPSYTIGTISSNVSEVRRGALMNKGFKIGIDDQIENLNDGNQHLADIASIQIAYELSERNSIIKDPNMTNVLAAIHTVGLSGIKSYGFGIINDTEKAKNITSVSPTDFATATEQGQYKAGQVVQTTNENNEPMFVVYTGVPDYKTGMPFIVLSGG
tara:strand:- start:145 stop:1320 length:1176 start_codon:yes stop_codon:yes gene_type:complete